MSLRRTAERYLHRRLNEITRPAARARAEPLADWAVRRVRLERRQFSFEGHEYLRQIYNDPASHVVLMKAAQIGGSVWAVLRSLHAAAMGLNVGYYFPTHAGAMEFSKSRIDPLIADNPFLAGMITDTDTAGLKRIGEGFLYLRGMVSPISLRSIPIDLLVFDELDEATPEAKAQARERLSHSDYRRRIELSNPSLPLYGIDEVYQKSDQRHWTIKCSGCGRWTALDREFPVKLGQEVPIILPRRDGTYYRACPHCAAELDIAAGEWVADFPAEPSHGYLISQLFSSKVDPGEILEEYRTTRFADRFYNLKIGIPWADLERRVDAGAVLALCTDASMLAGSVRACTMGVDTGKQLHVVILRTDPDNSRLEHLVYAGVCHDFSELDPLMRAFKVDRCAIDALPETHATRLFARRHWGRVFLVRFDETPRGEPEWDHTKMTVRINRTDALDLSRAALRDKRLVLPRRDRQLEEFARHVGANAKRLKEDPATGAKKYVYVSTGADHFSFALTYACMATTNRFGQGWIDYFKSFARERGASNSA